MSAQLFQCGHFLYAILGGCMPIYKTGEKRNGLTKYRVRVNYTDDSGKAHSLTSIRIRGG